MENIFLDFLNLSINASWLVLAVLVARLLLRKAPKWIYCVLWSLVGIRLVFPFSLESVFSLLPSQETISHDTLYQMNPTVNTGIEAINDVVNPVFSSAFASHPANSVNPLQVVTIISSYLWVIGMAAMVVYTFATYLRLKGKVKTATLLRENIFQSENVSSPFVLGLIKPKIYLPYNLSEEDMGHVIAHEKAHIKRKDHLIKPLAFLILTVYWFNPVMWLAYILLCRDIELACDEKVVKDFDRDNCKAYSYALLNCSINRKSIAACPLAFGEVGVKDRVKNILSYKKPAFWVIVIAVICCIVTAVCFLTVPKGVTLEDGYRYEPLSSETDRIEVITPEKTYTFTTKEQIENLSELINGITVDEDKTAENTEENADQIPSPHIIVKSYVGENQMAERCVNADFTKLWTSEEGECQYIFTTHKPEDIKSLFTTRVNNAYIKEQTEILMSELLIDFYGSESTEDFCYAESHFPIREEYSTANADKSVIEEIKVMVVYKCAEFGYDGYTLTEERSADGVAEFAFKVYDGERVEFDDFNEFAMGEDLIFNTADLDFTDKEKESINDLIKSEPREKAMAYFGIGTEDTEQQTAQQQGEGDGTFALSEVDFTYDIVPVDLISTYPGNAYDVENIVKEKALNSSYLIRNRNRQKYPYEYCLIYKEDNREDLISDYALQMKTNRQEEGFASMSDVIDKYSAVQKDKDMYLVYIPYTCDNGRNYAVTDFAYIDGSMTAVITSTPHSYVTDDADRYIDAFFAVIYVDKTVSEIYDSFNAVLKEQISVYDGGGEVNLSDIDTMNIGAETPKMLYCENKTLIMSGTFGLIVFDLAAEKVVDRLEYSLLEKLGINILNAKVSADGKRVYLNNYDASGKDSEWLYTYYLSTKQLYEYDGELAGDTLYDGLTVWDYDGSADLPEQNAIYGYELKDGGDGVYYLRANTDWSMKSLQVVHYPYAEGEEDSKVYDVEVIDVFR